MKVIEKYALTENERAALRNAFVPLAYMIGDDERASRQVNRILGNMTEYTNEQRDELIEAVREVITEVRKQATLDYWDKAGLLYGDMLAEMRYRESLALMEILIMLTGEDQ